MTKLLAQAFDRAAELPEDLQDQLARELLEEIEWESRWDATLADSHGGFTELCHRLLSFAGNFRG